MHECKQSLFKLEQSLHECKQTLFKSEQSLFECKYSLIECDTNLIVKWAHFIIRVGFIVEEV